jgi:hypothetical protein
MLLDWERGMGRDEERRDGRSDVGHGDGIQDSDEAWKYDALKDDNLWRRTRSWCGHRYLVKLSRRCHGNVAKLYREPAPLKK